MIKEGTILPPPPTERNQTRGIVPLSKDLLGRLFVRFIFAERGIALRAPMFLGVLGQVISERGRLKRTVPKTAKRPQSCAAAIAVREYTFLACKKSSRRRAAAAALSEMLQNCIAPMPMTRGASTLLRKKPPPPERTISTIFLPLNVVWDCFLGGVFYAAIYPETTFLVYSSLLLPFSRNAAAPSSVLESVRPPLLVAVRRPRVPRLLRPKMRRARLRRPLDEPFPRVPPAAVPDSVRLLPRGSRRNVSLV